jgi:hypothetical protein
MKNLAIGYVSTNCCFKDTGSGYVAFGTSTNYLYPADSTGTASHCNSPSYTDPLMRFMVCTSSTCPTGLAVPPLPATYFTSAPPIASTSCSVGANPAFFFKRY